MQWAAKSFKQRSVSEASVNARQQCSGKRSGFTLTEVLIAGAIGAIALTVVGRALVTGRRSVSMAERHAQALHAARATMEEITRASFFDGSLSEGRHAVAGGHYDVSVVDDYTKDIVVRIVWEGMSGSTNWVTLTTSISSALHN